MVDGTRLAGAADLRNALLSRSDDFVGTFIEKLMTFGLGRHVDVRDMPAIRRIAREAARDGDRFSAVVLGIARSEPFLMRAKSGAEPQKSRERYPQATTKLQEESPKGAS
jgi:hypothetical protein